MSTLASTATPSPNNDDYVGTFTNNGNKATFNSNAVPVASGRISHLEGVFAVLDSNGTTEYALDPGRYDSAVDPPLTAGYQLQLGFGKGQTSFPLRLSFQTWTSTFLRRPTQRCQPRSVCSGLRHFLTSSRVVQIPSLGQGTPSTAISFTRACFGCHSMCPTCRQT